MRVRNQRTDRCGRIKNNAENAENLRVNSVTPSWLVNALDVFQSSNVLQMVIPFVLFSTLLVIARGPSALKLSDETLRSVTVTLTLAILNGVIGIWLIFKADLSVGAFANLGLPGLTGDAFWDAVPWPVTILIVLLGIDFCDYWSHRVMHHTLLWGVHAVHHSEQRMTWMTSFRVHFLEASVMNLGYFLLLGWIGVPVYAQAAAITISFMHNRYVHVDLGWDHGPLDKVVASPNLHRWHHSVLPSAYNKNYANVFSLFDVMFGTYYNPGKCTTDVGLDELPNPGVLNQMFYPVTYLLSEIRRDFGPAQAKAQETKQLVSID